MAMLRPHHFLLGRGVMCPIGTISICLYLRIVKYLLSLVLAVGSSTKIWSYRGRPLAAPLSSKTLAAANFRTYGYKRFFGGYGRIQSSENFTE